MINFLHTTNTYEAETAFILGNVCGQTSPESFMQQLIHVIQCYIPIMFPVVLSHISSLYHITPDKFLDLYIHRYCKHCTNS